MGKGLIHIYCGDGKGKTTAALGLLLRASGNGMSVALARFLKGNSGSELAAMAHLPGVKVIPAPESVKFLWNMNAEEKAAYALQAQAMFECAASLPADVLILDELCAAVTSGLLPLARVLAFLDQRPAGQEIVITGRDPAPELLARADYISQVQCLRHPYEKGVPARRGIDY